MNSSSLSLDISLDSGIDKRASRVELLPLLDVIFLLLIVFIYAFLALNAERAVKLNLPSVGNGEAIERKLSTLSITADNKVFLDNEMIDKAKLGDILRSSFVNQIRPVQIAADRESSLELAIKILKVLQDTGVQEIAFRVQEES